MAFCHAGLYLVCTTINFSECKVIFIYLFTTVPVSESLKTSTVMQIAHKQKRDGLRIRGFGIFASLNIIGINEKVKLSVSTAEVIYNVRTQKSVMLTLSCRHKAIIII